MSNCVKNGLHRLSAVGGLSLFVKKAQQFQITVTKQSLHK